MKVIFKTVISMEKVSIHGKMAHITKATIDMT